MEMESQTNWISRFQYKPINLTLRQLTVNGVVQYHKSEAPRSYLQNSLSLLSCMVPVLQQAIHSVYAVTTSVLTGKCDPLPCHLLMMIHAGLPAPAVGYSSPLCMLMMTFLRLGAVGSSGTKSSARVCTCLTRDPPQTSL